MYQDFNPTGFDAQEWARLFKRVGFQFAVLTTKHHGGFCMFDTKTKTTVLRRFESNGKIHFQTDWSAYSIMETPFARDVVKEYSTALREQGLAVGLYFSHPDWMDYHSRFIEYHPWRDPDYTRHSDPQGWARGLKRHRQQVRELCSNYGKVDILSFDHGLPLEAWPELKGTLKMIRRLQPDVMLRLRGIGAWGDFFTPEGWAPDDLYDERIYQKQPWSVIGRYRTRDSVKHLLPSLISIVSAGGNMQINFNPDGKGRFSLPASRKLEQIGDWLRVNGEAIYAGQSHETALSIMNKKAKMLR